MLRALEMPPREPRTLVDVAYARLRADIIEGRLRPGDRLRVEHLKDEYQLGATPLREALSRLSAERLVEAIGQRGFRVAPVSLADLDDITEMRVLHETRALRDSMDSGDDAWEAGVVAAYHRLAKLDEAVKRRERGSYGEWEQRNRDFHDALISACRSPLLLHFREFLYDQHRRYRWMSLSQRTVGRDVAREHRELRDAAIARDVERACRLAAEHIRQTARVLRASLAPRLPKREEPARAGREKR